MKNKDFLIDYTVYAKNGTILKENGTMKVKNKSDRLEAQIKFEEFLKKKYSDFGKLIVHKCTEENIFNNPFGDIFKNSSFGDDNPFGF